MSRLCTGIRLSFPAVRHSSLARLHLSNASGQGCTGFTTATPTTCVKTAASHAARRPRRCGACVCACECLPREGVEAARTAGTRMPTRVVDRAAPLTADTRPANPLVQSLLRPNLTQYLNKMAVSTQTDLPTRLSRCELSLSERLVADWFSVRTAERIRIHWRSQSVLPLLAGYVHSLA